MSRVRYLIEVTRPDLGGVSYVKRYNMIIVPAKARCVGPPESEDRRTAGRPPDILQHNARYSKSADPAPVATHV